MQNPTTEFLESVAKVLRMNHQERQALFLYALGQLPPLTSGFGTTPHPDWNAFVERQRQPACIYSRTWDLVAANADYLDLLFGNAQGGVAGLPERNVLRWVLLNDEVRTTLVNWRTDWALPMLSELRAAIATSPECQALMALLHGLLIDPVVRELWNGGSSPRTHPDGMNRVIRHPRRGDVEFTILAASLMHPRDLRFVTLITSE